jgi:hypothetical protein
MALKKRSMVKDRHFLIIIIEAQVISQIFGPLDLNASNSSNISRIERPFQFHCFSMQSSWYHEVAVDAVFHGIFKPLDMFAASRAILESANIDHGN